MDCAVGMAPSVGLIKTPEDHSEDLLVHSLRPLDILVVNHALRVKEGHYHHLGSGNVAPGNESFGFSLPEPFFVVHVHVGVPGVHPALIHGDKVPEDPWVLTHEPGEEIAHITAALFVCICEDCRHKTGAFLFEFKVFFEYPVHSTGTQSGPQTDLPDGHPSV